MTRNDYLNILYHSLSPLADDERLALVRSYDSYFEDALRHGRAEEDVIRELGDPALLAVRILNARAAAVQPPPQTGPQTAPQPASGRMEPIAAEAGRSAGSRLLLLPLLALLNLIALPLGAGLWSALAGFGAGAAGALLAPVAVLLHWLRHAEFYPAMLFASIAATGAGILLAVLFFALVKALFRATVAYFRWNVKTLRGW